MSESLKGLFKPKNPEKYTGDPRNIVYRSSWELTVMNWLDLRESVERWGSEEKVVPYYDPVKKRWRRYFPDFVIRYKDSRGITITEMIEVKPYKYIVGPNPNPKRRTKSWVNEVHMYVTNQAKWKAATQYCEDRGWNFRLLSEKDIYGMK